jgi:hypothetical protein
MNIGSLTPPPNASFNRPIKVTPKGNLYKIPVSHTGANGIDLTHYEIWTTKEAVQKHFGGMTTEPQEYELKKFARQMYEKQLRSSNGVLEHKGMLVTSNNITHGDPRLWPNILTHPEIKV